MLLDLLARGRFHNSIQIDSLVTCMSEIILEENKVHDEGPSRVTSLLTVWEDIALNSDALHFFVNFTGSCKSKYWDDCCMTCVFHHSFLLLSRKVAFQISLIQSSGMLFWMKWLCVLILRLIFRGSCL